MCQLLGMNCNTPTDIVFSFEGFRRRAGLTDCHSAGFGIAFFEGKGVRVFRDDKPGCNSIIADAVKQYHIKSLNVIAHIRKATQGAVNIENTHPFIREIWGENWVFAQNGNLKELPDMSDSRSVRRIRKPHFVILPNNSKIVIAKNRRKMKFLIVSAKSRRNLRSTVRLILCCPTVNG